MNRLSPYRYEIEFDVLEACRNEYDRWIAENSVTWASHDAVAGFQIRHNRGGTSPEVRLVFGFRSMNRWASFVNSDVHENATTALTRVTTGLDARLWERSSIRLSEDTSRETTSTTPCDELPPVSEEPS